MTSLDVWHMLFLQLHTTETHGAYRIFVFSSKFSNKCLVTCLSAGRHKKKKNNNKNITRAELVAVAV